MTIKRMRKKIKNRKLLLNILLKFVKPSNKFMVMLSQNLDRYVSRYQMRLYKLHKKANTNVKKVDILAA